MSSFFNLSTHRLRLVLCVRDLLDRCVHVGQPTDTDLLYAKVATEYFVRWMGIALKMTRKDKKFPGVVTSVRLKLVARFFEIDVSGYGTQHIIVRDKSLLNELADIIVDTMVQPQFPVPSWEELDQDGARC